MEDCWFLVSWMPQQITEILFVKQLNSCGFFGLFFFVSSFSANAAHRQIDALGTDPYHPYQKPLLHLKFVKSLVTDLFLTLS